MQKSKVLNLEGRTDPVGSGEDETNETKKIINCLLSLFSFGQVLTKHNVEKIIHKL